MNHWYLVPKSQRYFQTSSESLIIRVIETKHLPCYSASEQD